MVGQRMEESRQRIATETALRLLTARVRRRILHRLAGLPDGASLDRLVGSLGETDSPEPTANGGLALGVAELHHVHLPMFQDADVIVYDADRKTVRRGRHFQEVLSLLRVIDDHRDVAVSAHS